MSTRTILLTDSTLREGEQAFGFNPPPDTKMKIAALLFQSGCDMIELGHPIVSKSITKTAKQISAQNPRGIGLVHSLLREEEIRLAKTVGARWIGFFLTVQPKQAKAKYGRRYQELISQIDPCIQLAKDLGLKVRFTCEDASRTSWSHIAFFYEYLLNRDVDLLGYADTTGTLLPNKARRTFRRLRKTFPNAKLHFHGHNDRGLALANGLEALAAGWDSLDASVLGLGERGGIIPLTEAAITLSEEYNKTLDLKQFPCLEQLVWHHVNSEHFGKRRFAHKAGLHCFSALQTPETYESLPLDKMGMQRIGILSKFSGTRSIVALAKSIGIHLSKQKALQITEHAKTLNQEIWRREDLLQFFSRFINT